MGIEPTTSALQVQCSTTKLSRHLVYTITIDQIICHIIVDNRMVNDMIYYIIFR